MSLDIKKIRPLVILLLAFTSPIGAVVPFGVGELTLSTSLIGSYDSRVIGGADSAGAYSYIISPKLNYYRSATLLKWSIQAGAAFNRFIENNELNSDDYSTGFQIALPLESFSTVKANLTSNYGEISSVDKVVNERVRSKSWSGAFISNIPLSQRADLTFGAAYSRSEAIAFTKSIPDDAYRLTKNYGRQTILSGNVGFQYADFFTDSKLTTQYSHSIATTEDNTIGQQNIDQSTDSFSVGLSRPLLRVITASVSYIYSVTDRGKFETLKQDSQSAGSSIAANLSGPFLPESLFPKVRSSLSLGYQRSQVLGLNDDGAHTYTGSSNIAWQARDRTIVTFAANRSISLSTDNFTVISTGFSTGLQQSIGESTSANITGSYNYLEFKGKTRRSNSYTLSSGIAQNINMHWVAAISYSYSKSNSHEKIVILADKYDQHVVLVSTTYNF